MYTNNSPRKTISPIAAEADAFVRHYYGTAFGDAFDASRRAQTPFSAAIASSTQQYTDGYLGKATPSPLLSSLSSLPPTWDGSDMGLTSWVTDGPQYSVADTVPRDAPTPPYPTSYLQEYTTNYGISPALISLNHNSSDLHHNNPTISPSIDPLVFSATHEQPMLSAMDSMPYDLTASLLTSSPVYLPTPAASPSSVADTPSPMTPPTLYDSDVDAEGETDDEYTPETQLASDAEDEYLPTPKTRGTRRRHAARRPRSSLSPRARTTRLESPRVPAVTAPRVVQAGAPYVELTAEQIASRVCPVCGGSFRGEHGASDLKRHHACHFPDAGKWMCRGVAAHRAGDFRLDPREAVMFQGERRCGRFCGKRFSRKDALLRHLRNSSEGCVSSDI